MKPVFVLLLRRWTRSQPPNAMSPWFDDNKAFLQILLRVQRQHSFQFGMHEILVRRQDAEIDNTRSAALHENKSAKVAVAGHKDSHLLVSDAEQIGVRSPCHSKLSGGNNVMSQAA